MSAVAVAPGPAAAGETKGERPGTPLRDRFIAGDPLRGIGVLTVFWVHVGQGVLQMGDERVAATDAYGSIFGPLTTEFTFAPFMFFALSAYLLARPFVDGGRRPSIRKYLRNRALRIVPAFWVLVLVVYLRHGDLGSGWLGVAVVPLFGQSLYWTPFADINLHAWTLDVELLFYVVLPLALFVRRWRIPILAVLTAGLFVVGIKYHAGGPETDTVRKLIGVFLYAFMPGVLLAALEPYVRPWLPAHRRVADALTWALLAYFVFAVVVRIYGEPTLGKMHGLVASGGVAVLAAALLRQWTHGSSWKLIDGRVIHWLGERSYSLYLWHLFVALEVVDLAGEGTPGLPTYFGLGFVILAITLVLAELSYRYVEMPFLRRKLPWSRTPRTPASQASPAS